MDTLITIIEVILSFILGVLQLKDVYYYESRNWLGANNTMYTTLLMSVSLFAIGIVQFFSLFLN